MVSISVVSSTPRFPEYSVAALRDYLWDNASINKGCILATRELHVLGVPVTFPKISTFESERYLNMYLSLTIYSAASANPLFVQLAARLKCTASIAIKR